MKSFTASLESPASPKQAWAAWTDLANWPEHDPTLEYIHLEKFGEGAKGKLKPKSAPFASTIIIEQVVDGKSFTIRTPLPLCTMYSHHVIEPLSGKGSRFVFATEFTGPLAGLFAMAIGKGIQKNVKPTMELLSKLATEKY